MTAPTDVPAEAARQAPADAGGGVAATGARPDHLGGVDGLRLVGITGIVYYHAADVWYPGAPGSAQAFAGLHALTAAACYFAAASRSATSVSDIVVRRFNRLIVPWLAFSALHMASALRSGNFQTWMLWMGGAMHLWFLPFIFVLGCAIATARRAGLIVRGGPSAVAWTFAAVSAMLVEPHLGVRLPETPGPWQALNALPSALLGVAIFALPERRSRLADVVQLLVIASVGVAVSMTPPLEPRAWPAAAALGGLLFGVARLLPVRATAASDFVGRTSFGVYLLHMIVLTVLIRGLAKLAPGAVATEPNVLIILAQVAAAVVGCVALVAIAERTPLRRFVV